MYEGIKVCHRLDVLSVPSMFVKVHACILYGPSFVRYKRARSTTHSFHKLRFASTRAKTTVQSSARNMVTMCCCISTGKYIVPFNALLTHFLSITKSGTILTNLRCFSIFLHT